MIKFKVLRWGLIAFIAIKGLLIVGYVFIIRRILYDISVPYSPILPHCVGIAQLVLSSLGLYFIQRSCRKFIVNGYFNKESASDLKIGAYVSGLTAFATLFWGVLWRQSSKTDGFEDAKNFTLYLNGISHQLTMLIVSLALLAVADLVRRAAKIKLENDLTI